MDDTVSLSQGSNLAGKVGIFPKSYTQSPAASPPSNAQTQLEPVREGTNYNNTVVDAATDGSNVAGGGGVMRDTMAMSERRGALDAVDSNSPSPPLPSSIHKILSETGVTPLQVVNRFTRELLEQGHCSEALMGRAEPSVEMLEVAVALARQAEVSIRLREAAVQEKEAEVNLKELETQRREAELDRREQEVRLKEAEARSKGTEVARRAKGTRKKEAEARLLKEKAQQTLEAAQRIESSAREVEAFAKMLEAAARKRELEAKKREAETQLTEAQARGVEVLVRDTEGNEEARLEARFEHLLEQMQGVISAYRQEAKEPRIIPKTTHQPNEQPCRPWRQSKPQANGIKAEIQNVEEQLLEAVLIQHMANKESANREADLVSLPSTIRSTSSNRTRVGLSSKSHGELKEDSEDNDDEISQQLVIERQDNGVRLEADSVSLALSIRDTFKHDNVDVSPTTDARLEEGSEDCTDEGSDGFINISSI